MRMQWIKISFLLIIVFSLFSCNIFEGESTSNSVLIINSITDENNEVPIFSNVYNMTNDLAKADITALKIDPYDVDNTYYDSIIVDQVDIEYSRADGLNEEGKDIPFSFSQKVYSKVDINAEVELPFTIVQHVAKMESPLVDLVDWGEEWVLKLEARITFHGYDVGGHRIEPVIATVSVWCANFGEEEE